MLVGIIRREVGGVSSFMKPDTIVGDGVYCLYNGTYGGSTSVGYMRF